MGVVHPFFVAVTLLLSQARGSTLARFPFRELSDENRTTSEPDIPLTVAPVFTPGPTDHQLGPSDGTHNHTVADTLNPSDDGGVSENLKWGLLGGALCLVIFILIGLTYYTKRKKIAHQQRRQMASLAATATPQFGVRGCGKLHRLQELAQRHNQGNESEGSSTDVGPNEYFEEYDGLEKPMLRHEGGLFAAHHDAPHHDDFLVQPVIPPAAVAIGVRGEPVASFSPPQQRVTSERLERSSTVATSSRPPAPRLTRRGIDVPSTAIEMKHHTTPPPAWLTRVESWQNGDLLLSRSHEEVEIHKLQENFADFFTNRKVRSTKASPTPPSGDCVDVLPQCTDQFFHRNPGKMLEQKKTLTPSTSSLELSSSDATGHPKKHEAGMQSNGTTTLSSVQSELFQTKSAFETPLRRGVSLAGIGYNGGHSSPNFHRPQQLGSGKHTSYDPMENAAMMKDPRQRKFDALAQERLAFDIEQHEAAEKTGVLGRCYQWLDEVVDPKPAPHAVVARASEWSANDMELRSKQRANTFVDRTSQERVVAHWVEETRNVLDLPAIENFSSSVTPPHFGTPA